MRLTPQRPRSTRRPAPALRRPRPGSSRGRRRLPRAANARPCPREHAEREARRAGHAGPAGGNSGVTPEVTERARGTPSPSARRAGPGAARASPLQRDPSDAAGVRSPHAGGAAGDSPRARRARGARIDPGPRARPPASAPPAAAEGAALPRPASRVERAASRARKPMARASSALPWRAEQSPERRRPSHECRAPAQGTGVQHQKNRRCGPRGAPAPAGRDGGQRPTGPGWAWTSRADRASIRRQGAVHGDRQGDQR